MLEHIITQLVPVKPHHFQSSMYYRTRAINRRSYYSRIIVLESRLPHKNRIKKCVLAWKVRGAATNWERLLMARVRYLIT